MVPMTASLYIKVSLHFVLSVPDSARGAIPDISCAAQGTLDNADSVLVDIGTGNDLQIVFYGL